MPEVDSNRLDLAKWLENQSRKCTYVEMRSSPAEASKITGWEISDSTFASLLGEIDEFVIAESGGVPKAFYLFSFKREDDPKPASRFIVRSQLASVAVDDGGKGVIAELRVLVRELANANLEASKVVVDQCRALGEASTAALAETTKQLVTQQKEQWRVNEMIRDLAEGKREEKREETEAHIAKMRASTMGELVAALIPAIAAKLSPGIQAKNAPTGDHAVMALFRTLSEKQIDTLTGESLLELTPEQMIAAFSLGEEIERGMSNGGIASALMRQLAAWFAMLNDAQTLQLKGTGKAKLDGVQTSAFMNLYMSCKEYAETRAASAEARPS